MIAALLLGPFLPRHRTIFHFRLSTVICSRCPPPRNCSRPLWLPASVALGIFGLNWCGKQDAKRSVLTPCCSSEVRNPSARLSISIPRKLSNIPATDPPESVWLVWSSASCKISNVTTPLVEPSASWNHLGLFRTWFYFSWKSKQFR